MDNQIEYPENLVLEIAGRGYGRFSDRQDIDFAVKHFDENWAYFVEQLSANHERAKERAEIVIEYYKDRKTLKKIGEEHSLSVERIRQIIQVMIHYARSNYFMPFIFVGKKTLSEFETLKEKYERLINEYKQKIIDLQSGKSTQEIMKARGDTSIDELDLSVRSNNVLRRAGLNTIAKIEAYVNGGNRLVLLRNMGKKSFNEIQDRLSVYGIEIKE